MGRVYNSWMNSAKQSFPPLIHADCNVLVLGTLPGEDSLKFQQYYGHKRNAFWRIISDITGQSLMDNPYQTKCTALLQQRIALWDTLAAAQRKGSLDSNIRTPLFNNIPLLLHDYPNINRIAFNGKKARHFFKTHENALPSSVALFDLPSTSPAYTLAYKKKLAAWREVLANPEQ